MVIAAVSDLDKREELRLVEVNAAKEDQELHLLPQLHLVKKERELLSLLMRRERMHREVAFAHIYSDKMPEDRPDPKTMDVQMSHLRTKLSTIGINVKTDHGVGWYLTTEDKLKIRGFSDPRNGAPVDKDPLKFKIEKNIPLPTHGWTHSRYPFGEMEVGDSFLAVGLKQQNVRSSVSTWRKRCASEWKFAVRQTAEGVRVWRVA